MTAWAETPEAVRRWGSVNAIQALIEESALLAYEAGMGPEALLTVIADTLRPMMDTETLGGGEN